MNILHIYSRVVVEYYALLLRGRNKGFDPLEHFFCLTKYELVITNKFFLEFVLPILCICKTVSK